MTRETVDKVRSGRATHLAEMLRRHRIESEILVLFLIVSAAGFLLAWLGSEVLEGDKFALDRSILRGLRTPLDAAVPVGPHWLAAAMIDITALGSMTVLTLITVCAVGFLVALRKHATAMFVALAVISGALLSAGLKRYFFRARPEIVPHLVNVTSASFPSGHAMNSAFVYLTLATLLARAQQDRRVRIYLLAVAIILTLLVGISRVFLGVHWPTDVIAGWCAGAIWATICSLIEKALTSQHRSRRLSAEALES